MKSPTPKFPVPATLSPIADLWEWQNDGECRKHDAEIFFLESHLRGPDKQKKIARAKQICVPCPVKQQCLEHALKTPEYYGVWGGLSEEERGIILQRQGRWRLGKHINLAKN